MYTHAAMIKKNILSCFLLLGCIFGLAAKTQTMPLVPAGNFFLRNTYDVDPSTYIGRFVKDDVQAPQIDEASTFKSRCSSFIQPQVIQGGNVLVEQLFNASVNAGASAGVGAAGLKIANLGFSLLSSNVIRAKYITTAKMLSDIPDAGALEDCCKMAPDQCSQRYISEFIQGTGALYVGATKGRQVKTGIEQGSTLMGLDTRVYPEVEFGQSMSWFRGAVFTTPVYFAFKLSDTGPWNKNVCESDWVRDPPRVAQGQYVIGISATVPQEGIARDLALANAREQVVKLVGEQIVMGTISTSTVVGGAVVSTALQSETTVQRAATGMAKFVKDHCWKIEEIDQVNGLFYKAYVLAFVPNASLTQAAEALSETVRNQ